MDIRTSDLNNFKKLSSNIKTSGILPIQEYLKFGKGVIQKQVTSSFIQFDCPGVTEDILVEEKVLYDLMNNSSSPIFSINTIKGKTVISDFKTTISIQVPPLSDFTDIETGEVKKVMISHEFLEAIGAAAILCQPMGTVPDKYMYVMIGNKGVTGISVPYGYYRPIEEDVTMSLEKSIAIFVSRTDVYACAVTDTHYIFYTEKGAIMGFTKQAVGYGDFAKMLRDDKTKLTFTSSNEDIRSYNSLAVSLCKLGPVVTMTTKGELIMYDNARDISQNQVIESIKPFEDFTYNPTHMNLVLSAMGTEDLDFYQTNNMLLIKDIATKSVAAIGKILNK